MEAFELDDRDRKRAPVAGYPVWWTRKWIGPYAMADDEVQRLIDTNIVGVFSWVTAANEPVTAMLDYVMLDDHIHVTSTSNRAKYKAWSHNHAAACCIFNWANDQESVNLRGHVELIHDRDLLGRFVRGMLVNRLQVDEVPAEVFEAQFALFDAPDRAVVRFHIDKVLSYDGARLRRTEREGIDHWGVSRTR